MSYGYEYEEWKERNAANRPSPTGADMSEESLYIGDTESEIVDSDGVRFAATYADSSGVRAKRARRLVACWNACKGVSTEALEHGIAVNWKPIETAPKDGTRVLLYIPGYIGAVCGQWRDESVRKIPKPYWRTDFGAVFGKRWSRENQPTHWMPLPPAPEPKA